MCHARVGGHPDPLSPVLWNPEILDSRFRGNDQIRVWFAVSYVTASMNESTQHVGRPSESVRTNQHVRLD